MSRAEQGQSGQTSDFEDEGEGSRGVKLVLHALTNELVDQHEVRHLIAERRGVERRGGASKARETERRERKEGRKDRHAKKNSNTKQRRKGKTRDEGRSEGVRAGKLSSHSAVWLSVLLCSTLLCCAAVLFSAVGCVRIDDDGDVGEEFEFGFGDLLHVVHRREQRASEVRTECRHVLLKLRGESTEENRTGQTNRGRKSREK